MRRRILGVLAIGALAAPTASGQTLVFTEDELVIVASAAPDTSFVGGVGNTTITIDQSTGDFGAPGASDGLIRFLDFSVSPLAIVRSATLDFYTTSATDGPVGVYQMTTDWDAATTWNSLGGDGLTIGVETLSEPLDSVADIGEDVLTKFDVTAAVERWAAGEADYLGFGIRNESGDGWDIQTETVGPNPAPVLTVQIEVPAPVKLQVDRTTGFGRFVSVADGFDVEVRGYELLSETDSFAAADWGATNLSAQAIDAIDPATPGDRWDTVNATGGQLYEAYLNGASTLSPGESRGLGRLVSPGDESAFSATVVTTNFLGGADAFNSFDNVNIEFVDFEVLPGDFNNDGAVDAADYTVWRGGGSGSVSPADFATWTRNYGAVSPNSASRATPEPTGLAALLSLGGVLLAASRRHLRSRR